MIVSVGSDGIADLPRLVIQQLKDRQCSVHLRGALKPGEDTRWPEVARKVAQDVSEGRADQGILFCWTGTGVSITANKVPGIRAALCGDAETAKGAKMYNDANVLCISLRLTSPQIGSEILDMWLSTDSIEESEADNIQRVKDMDKVIGSRG